MVLMKKWQFWMAISPASAASVLGYVMLRPFIFAWLDPL